MIIKMCQVSLKGSTLGRKSCCYAKGIFYQIPRANSFEERDREVRRPKYFVEYNDAYFRIRNFGENNDSDDSSTHESSEELENEFVIKLPEEKRLYELLNIADSWMTGVKEAIKTVRIFFHL
jgi:hypothetical protein